MLEFDRQLASVDLDTPLFEKQACPLCGGECSKESYPINKAHPSRISGFDLSQVAVGVSSCVGCGHQFIQPVPTTRFLAAYYAYYITQAKENFYRRRQLIEIPTSFRQVYGERLSRIQAVVGGTGSLLDVGCGFGMFLRLAKEYGFDVSGVEANADAAKWLKETCEIHVERCLFENFETSQGFDVITMWDLLEHLADPIAALRKAFALLRPGGVLIVETPARDSVVHWIAKLAYPSSRRWQLGSWNS